MLTHSIATHRSFSKILLTVITLSLALVMLPGKPAAAAANAEFFAATGHSVSGAFLAAYHRLGGLPNIGYPITDETTENGFRVQYFERERFEYHPENAGTQYEVLLSRLGVELSQPFQPFAPGRQSGEGRWFPETQHNVSGDFLRYWNDKGGLSLFGFPISEPFSQNGVITQYFERARFEYHPEVAGSSGYAVQLGLLGVTYLQQKGGQAAPAPAPAQPQLSGGEQQLLNDLNNARAAAGLGKLTIDPQLLQLAHDRANDMANRSYFNHVNPEGNTFIDLMNQRGIPYNNCGEIIHRNTFPADQAEAQAYNAFMNSQHHHDIIMTADFNFVGVAEAQGKDGYRYYTVIFAAR